MVSNPNVVLLQLDCSVDRAKAIVQIQDSLSSLNSDLMVFELNATLENNVNFLSAIWSVVMFLPLFGLIAATLCLIAYLLLAIDEKHQEWGFAGYRRQAQNSSDNHCCSKLNCSIFQLCCRDFSGSNNHPYDSDFPGGRNELHYLIDFGVAFNGVVGNVSIKPLSCCEVCEETHTENHVIND
jgi:hypothetical protein